MPSKSDKSGKQLAIIPGELTEDHKPFYSNMISVTHTPWDFALHFQLVVVPARITKPSIEAQNVVTVSLPPTLLHGLIEALQTNLEKYENQFGKIDIPKKTDISEGRQKR